jgi:hypothetical protein
MGRSAASALVARAAGQARAEDRPLRDVVMADQAIASRIPPDELQHIFDAGPAVAAAAHLVDAVLNGGAAAGPQAAADGRSRAGATKRSTGGSRRKPRQAPDDR